ncbi:MAG: hypothetical protein ACWGN1_03850, partial [Desulfobulbales bacterium]
MIIDIERTNLNQITNPVMAAFASRYVDIYADFMEQVAQTGIQVAEHDGRPVTLERRQRLASKGVHFRN